MFSEYKFKNMQGVDRDTFEGLVDLDLALQYHTKSENSQESAWLPSWSTPTRLLPL